MKQLVGIAGSASALAKRAGISGSGLHRYLTGGEPTRTVLVALANAAQVSVHWLATGEGSMTGDRSRSSMGTLTRLPLLAPGDGGGEKKQLRALAFCRKWLGVHGLEASQLIALQMRGHSMEPTIGNGDMVVIDVGQKEVVDGDIYLVRDSETALLKRVQRQLRGKLRLLCDNASYPAVEYDERSLDLVGRVVWRGSLL